MMDRFTRARLRELMTPHHPPCLSLYMPTHPAGNQARQDPIRCKNLMHRAEEPLREMGLRRPEIEALLEPLERQRQDTLFWRSQSRGLAVFAAPDEFHRYRVPLEFDERVVVEDRFYVKPLLPLLQEDGRFYLLAVSLNRVRFFEGTKYTISEMSVETLPKNLVDALNIDEYQHSLQFHKFTSFGVSNVGGDETIYHGQGGSGDEVRKKDELLQYFRRLADGLDEFFGDESTPLIFAGVEYLFPIFREANRYRRLVEEPVTGNPDELKPAELHDRAWRVAEPLFRRQRVEALEQYGRFAARNLASDDLDEILAATRQGGVDTLFVARDAVCWGRMDPDTGKVELTPATASGAEDLLDLAVVQTLLQGGAVFTVDSLDLPSGLFASAIFRFPIGRVRSRTSVD